VGAVSGVGAAAAGLGGAGGEGGEGGAAEAWHGGAQLYVSLKMENAEISGDLVPHVYGSEPIIGTWDPSRAVRTHALPPHPMLCDLCSAEMIPLLLFGVLQLAMERELASMWELSFVVPPDHGTLPPPLLSCSANFQ